MCADFVRRCDASHHRFSSCQQRSRARMVASSRRPARDSAPTRNPRPMALASPHCDHMVRCCYALTRNGIHETIRPPCLNGSPGAHRPCPRRSLSRLSRRFLRDSVRSMTLGSLPWALCIQIRAVPFLGDRIFIIYDCFVIDTGCS